MKLSVAERRAASPFCPPKRSQEADSLTDIGKGVGEGSFCNRSFSILNTPWVFLFISTQGHSFPLTSSPPSRFELFFFPFPGRRPEREDVQREEGSQLPIPKLPSFLGSSHTSPPSFSLGQGPEGFLFRICSAITIVSSIRPPFRGPLSDNLESQLPACGSDRPTYYCLCPPYR